MNVVSADFSSCVLAWSKNLYEKRACMTLMKLTKGLRKLSSFVNQKRDIKEKKKKEEHFFLEFEKCLSYRD